MTNPPLRMSQWRGTTGAHFAKVGNGCACARRVLRRPENDVHGIRDGERGDGMGGDKTDCTYVLEQEDVMYVEFV